MRCCPSQEWTLGLSGVNSALTSLVVGVFFVPPTPPRCAVVLSVCGTATTVSLFGAMQTVLGASGAPCVTLPCCCVMYACSLLHKQVPVALVLASHPHSPEKTNK
mmetsp:Transcript_14937/g.16123  ORF Transcript_14937/g.16123 Transcript_14937/m.16123 type:complete len:105 (+) Transcript_14937:275-589(+)